MIINRVWASPSKWTFTIKPIAELVSRYVGDGRGWVDPFAGMNSPAQITNDMDTEMPTMYHMEAEEFCRSLPGSYDGVLVDPPYSYRQISEHYRGRGIKATYKDTSYNFYKRVYKEIAPKIKEGGVAISCGWNSNGVGKCEGFDVIEVLLVAHGLHHNDTIVTVERKRTV
uniref:Putative methyltransferase n=1 Tax=viral metagenome TaxID=1070528 RepID=A0A6M3L0X0_9ZZZZ